MQNERKMKDAPLLNWTNFDPYRCSGRVQEIKPVRGDFFFLNSHKVDKKNSSPVLSSQAESSLSFPVSPHFLDSARLVLTHWGFGLEKKKKENKSLRAMLDKRGGGVEALREMDEDIIRRWQPSVI